MNLGEFSDRFNKMANEMEKNVDHIMRRVASDVHAHVVIATPVKTGKARSNWIVSLGVGNEQVIETYGRDAAVSSTLNAAAAVISNHKGTQPIYIQNNVDYIIKLNEGSSMQAPSGFVLRASEVAVQAIETSANILIRSF